jgi:hypothetical protein
MVTIQLNVSELHASIVKKIVSLDKKWLPYYKIHFKCGYTHKLKSKRIVKDTSWKTQNKPGEDSIILCKLGF